MNMRNVSTVYSLAVNDYVQLTVIQVSGATKNIEVSGELFP